MTNNHEIGETMNHIPRENYPPRFDAIVWLRRITGTSWEWKDGKFITMTNAPEAGAKHMQVNNDMGLENSSSTRTLRALYNQGFTPTTTPIKRESGVTRFQYSVPEAEVFDKAIEVRYGR